MTVEEMKQNIVAGFIADIQETADSFATEFCNALNEAERLREENKSLREELQRLKVNTNNK